MAFYPCTADRLDSFLTNTITSLYSEVRNMRNNACFGATNLVEVNFPYLESVPVSGFRDCLNLISVNLPNVTTLYNNAFYASNKIEILDFPKLTTISGTNIFFSCSKLETLIFRSNNVVSLTDLNTWGYTPFGTGRAGGKIYVPQSLVSAYEADTYWSQVLALNPLNQVLAIEGSPYES